MVYQQSPREWWHQQYNSFVEEPVKNWKAREYTIMQQIHAATGTPMERIGVIGGENVVQIFMGVTIAQADLPKLNAVLAELDCLTHIIWL